MKDTSTHHLYYPKRNYTTRVEKIFRSLPCHKVEMSIEGHRLLHQLAFQDNGVIPDKPSENEMWAKINYCQKQCKGNCDDD